MYYKLQLVYIVNYMMTMFSRNEFEPVSALL